MVPDNEAADRRVGSLEKLDAGDVAIFGKPQIENGFMLAEQEIDMGHLRQAKLEIPDEQDVEPMRGLRRIRNIDLDFISPTQHQATFVATQVSRDIGAREKADRKGVGEGKGGS